MAAERFEKVYELSDTLDAKRALNGRWVWEYYGAESGPNTPGEGSASSEESALSDSPVSFLVRQTMTVVGQTMLTATNVELSVRSDQFVRSDHDIWYQEHVLPVLDDRTASALAHSPGSHRRSFIENRVSWGKGEMRLRRYPLNASGPASVAFCFADETSAHAFEPPKWPGLRLDTLQDRHVYSVEVANDPAPIEYEVRYLVDVGSLAEFRSGAQRRWIGQSYLIVSEAASLRVRVKAENPLATASLAGEVAVKGPRDASGARLEIQGVLPGAVAKAFTLGTSPSVEKYRYSRVTDDGYAWEVDEFLGANAPLHIAECEVTRPEELSRIRPQSFCGEEITADPAYNNEWLAIRPYSTW